MALHFLIRYTQSGSKEQREVLRGEHIAFRKALGGDLVLAGPILSDAGEPVGSVVILAADTPADAHAIALKDPYVMAELLTILSIEHIRIAAINPPA